MTLAKNSAKPKSDNLLPALPNYLCHKKIAVIGLGISGLSVYQLLLKAGVAPENLVTFDDKNSSANFNDSVKLQKEFDPDLLVISPGVPLSTPWIQEYQKSGGAISSELSIAFGFLTTEKIIAVTGSIGKSTVTSLIGIASLNQNNDNFFGGNLGCPLADYVQKVYFDKANSKADWITLELSSYQLENFANLKADISVFTYLSPNHLERYVDLSAYYNTKLNLLQHTEGPIVCNQNGGDLKKSITPNPATASVCQKIFWCHRHDLNMQKYHIQSCNMVGTHNLDNLAVALQVGLLCQWPTSFIKSLSEFAGLPHRLENIGHYDFEDIRNIQFINDSKSTTMNSVLEAVESVLPNVPKQSNLVLLLGGKDKNLPWSQLSVLGKHSNIRFLFFGSVANTAKEQSALDGSTYTSLNEAMSNLRKHLTSNDIVLLSPGGTSLDEFKNFEERGDFFKKKITSI